MEACLWDENRTVVVPKAVFAAFPFAIWAAGDKVGARVAFRERYPERLAEHGQAVHVSLGWDATQREPTVREAVESGRLSRAQAQAVLPHLDLDAPAQLEGPQRDAPRTARGMPSHVRDQLRAILGEPETTRERSNRIQRNLQRLNRDIPGDAWFRENAERFGTAAEEETP